MEDIKLKDAAGRTKTYSNVPKVWMESADGKKLVPFTYGEAVSKTISLDFTNGDMTVSMPEGQLAKDLTILKPENLVSRNIAEGVNIAGVIGSLIATGGDSGGDFHVKTGSFQTPSLKKILSDSFIEGFDGCTKATNGYFQKVNTPAVCTLTAGAKYKVRHTTTKNVTAVSHTSFATYGRCITIGNQYMVTGNQEDNTREDWLVIYQQNYNRTTMFVDDHPGDSVDESGMDHAYNIIEIWENPVRDRTVVVHGETQKPDAVFVMMTGIAGILEGSILSAWSVKYDLNQITPSNIVGVLVMSNACLSSRDYSLDNSHNPRGLLYCPDNLSIAMDATGDGSYELNPGTTYAWFAFWGIESE